MQAAKLFLAISLCFLFLLPAYGQSTGNYRAFINLDYRNNYKFNASGGIGGPTAGFGWQNKIGNWHELELLGIGIGKNTAILGLRYQHNVMLFKKSEFMFQPFVGMGIENRLQYSQTTDAVYKGRFFNARLSSYISPGIQYNARKSGFYASLQLPVELLSMGAYSYKVSSALPVQQNRSEIRFDGLPFNTFDARLGIGYRF